MKNFFNQIPSVLKGFYFLWVTIVLYLISSSGRSFSYKFPQFFFVLIMPLLLYSIIYYLKPKEIKPRFLKGLYLMWFASHSVLLILSGNISRSKFYFYPHYLYGNFQFDISYYNFPSFLIYTIIPILIALTIYYLLPQKDKRAP